MYAGVFTGVGVEGGGLKYVMKTHSKLHPQTRKDSIPYVKQDIKASPFKWCIKTYFHIHCIYMHFTPDCIYKYFAPDCKHILKKLERYAVFYKSES